MIKKTGFFCIAILAMSCMFFAGQSWAQCSGPTDSDGDGIPDNLDPCDNDTTNECFLETPDTCETFIGPNPVAPGAMLCGTGGNQLCVMEYKLCANGTAEKRWDPAPGSTMPGPYDGAGTWSQDGRTLTIDTKDPDQMTSGMWNNETYDTAFVYYEGGKTKLDLNSAAKTTAPYAGIYQRHSTTHAVMPPPPTVPIVIDMFADSTTVMTVPRNANANSWTSTLTVDITCTDGMGGALCGAYGDTSVTTTDPPLAPAVQRTPGSLYILQVNTSLVLVRQ